MTAAPSVALTWIGHATVLVEVDGYRILTDPVLSARVAHLRRRVALPAVGPVDAVLISHVHMDHLHVPSLGSVTPGSRVVVPRGAEPLVAKVATGPVDGVEAGTRLTLRPAAPEAPAVEVEVVPARHRAGRGPHSRLRAEPVGYVVHAGGRAVYFAGDTALFEGMRHMGRLDVALLPIWGWGPTLGQGHLDPAGAATATAWLDPAIVVPIHWGTLSPVRAGRGAPPWLDHPVHAFRAELRSRALEDRLAALAPGGSLALS